MHLQHLSVRSPHFIFVLLELVKCLVGLWVVRHVDGGVVLLDRLECEARPVRSRNIRTDFDRDLTRHFGNVLVIQWLLVALVVARVDQPACPPLTALGYPPFRDGYPERLDKPDQALVLSLERLERIAVLALVV